MEARRATALLLSLATAVGCSSVSPTEPRLGRLVKEALFEVPGVKTITGFGWTAAGGDRQLVVAGQLGAGVLEADGRLAASVTFPLDREILSTPWHVEPIDLDGDGVLEFLNRGGNWHRVGIFRSDGEMLWTTENESAPNSMAMGDLDLDGSPDFVVGLNGGGGVQRLDGEGREVWTRPDSNVWQVELVDVEGDGPLEILHTNAAGTFVLRDPDGSVRREFEIGEYGNVFAVLRGGRVFQHAGDRFLVYDLRTRSQTELPAATGGRFSDMYAFEVRFQGMGAPATVLLESNRSDPLSVLHVFDARGRLVHEEALEEACAGLGAEPASPGGESLLLGCGERVWRYRAARSARDLGEPVVSAAAFMRGGDAIGPVSFGDSRRRAIWRLRLVPGARCHDEKCRVVARGFGEDASILLVPDDDEEGLSFLVALARTSASGDRDRVVRSEWETLVRWAEQEFGPPRSGGELPPISRLTATLETHVWESETRRVIVGVRVREKEGAERRYDALALITPAPDPVAPPAPASPSP